MLDKIYSFIQKYDMLKSGDTVVCGLSGGADSVALLLALFSLKDRLGILDNNRVKVYVNSSLLPLLKLYGKNQIQDVDYLLTSFYQLDDEAREEIISSIQVKLKYHKDPERAKDVKGLKPY